MTPRGSKPVVEVWFMAIILLLLMGLINFLASCRPVSETSVGGPTMVPSSIPKILQQSFKTPAEAKSIRPDKDRRYRTHPKGWIETHTKDGLAKPEQCIVCHASESCVACHQDKVPSSHKSLK
ncbi:MAG: hypothetical protein ACPL7O_00725, partial [Armatimonadota bacterium]